MVGVCIVCVPMCCQTYFKFCSRRGISEREKVKLNSGRGNECVCVCNLFYVKSPFPVAVRFIFRVSLSLFLTRFVLLCVRLAYCVNTPINYSPFWCVLVYVYVFTKISKIRTVGPVCYPPLSFAPTSCLH